MAYKQKNSPFKQQVLKEEQLLDPKIAAKIKAIEDSPRLNRRIKRREEMVEIKKEKAKNDSKKLAKIEKKYGYNYDAALKAGLSPDESGHWDSINPSDGMILKGPRHPSIMKTRKIERVLGNKIIRMGGERYSVPRKK